MNREIQFLAGSVLSDMTAPIFSKACHARSHIGASDRFREPNKRQLSSTARMGPEKQRARGRNPSRERPNRRSSRDTTGDEGREEDSGLSMMVHRDGACHPGLRLPSGPAQPPGLLLTSGHVPPVTLCTSHCPVPHGLLSCQRGPLRMPQPHHCLTPALRAVEKIKSPNCSGNSCPPLGWTDPVSEDIWQLGGEEGGDPQVLSSRLKPGWGSRGPL